MDKNINNEQINKSFSNLIKNDFYKSKNFDEEKDKYINNLIYRICYDYKLFPIGCVNCSSPAMRIENNFPSKNFNESQFIQAENSNSSEIYSSFNKNEIFDFQDDLNSQIDEYINDEEDFFDSLDSITDASTGEDIQKEEESAIAKIYLELKNINISDSLILFNKFIDYLTNK